MQAYCFRFYFLLVTVIIFGGMAPLEVTLKLTVPTPEVVYSVLSAEAVLREDITPREDGMWYGYCEICVNKSPNASIRTPRLTKAAHQVLNTYLQSRDRLGNPRNPRKFHAVVLSPGLRVPFRLLRARNDVPWAVANVQVVEIGVPPSSPRKSALLSYPHSTLLVSDFFAEATRAMPRGYLRCQCCPSLWLASRCLAQQHRPLLVKALRNPVPGCRERERSMD